VKKFPRLIAASLATVIPLLCLCLQANGVVAQSPITWDVPLTISSDTDVRTDGTLFGAINNGGPGVFSVTVNGIDFVQFAGSSYGHFEFTTDNPIGVEGEDWNGPTGAGVSGEYSALASGFSLADRASSGSPPTMILTINDLVIGQMYLVQIWANESSGLPQLGSGKRSNTLTAGNSVSLRVNTSGTDGGRGQYATGTFTATASSEAITITGVSTDPINFPPHATVSAVQVRAISGTPGPGRLMNLSTRAHVGTGGDVAIAGIIIQGQSTKKVIIRALGPTLSQLGVNGVLADPVLDLFDHSGASIGHNDDWRSTQEQQILDTNLAPPDNKESAIVATLQPGNYTAIVTGANGTTGVALVEVYDLP
jgi:hypothetical protein